MKLILQAINALLRGLEKRINQAIHAPETAEVGQMIVVKEVDEHGKPTKWEAVDMPEVPEQVNADWNQNDPNAPGYVESRPFYEEVTTEEIVIELAAGGPTVVDADVCAKLFENRETATYIIDGKIGSFMQMGSIIDGYWDYLVTNGRNYYVCCEGETIAFRYSGDGTYAPGTIRFSAVTNTVHKLGEKFIPDNYLKYQIVEEVPAEQEAGVLYIVQSD